MRRRERLRVVAVEQVDSRRSIVAVRKEDGQSYRITAQYVVDATGRDSLLSSKKRLRRKNNEHQSAAIGIRELHARERVRRHDMWIRQ